MKYCWRFDEIFDPCADFDGGRDLTEAEYRDGCERIGERLMEAHWQPIDSGGSLPVAPDGTTFETKE